MLRFISPFEALGLLSGFSGGQPAAADRLVDLGDFGANPGALRAQMYLPEGLPAGAPLVVVLHGCGQSAEDYDHGAGWSALADELGFALLFPQQQRANNPNLCFNWFSPIDARRDSGEAGSIHAMVARMIAAHAIDAGRIFVTGLSAGGAMASILLATYPDVFAGGAIVAGLPFGAAASVGDALARMRGDGFPDDAQLAEAIRSASDHTGPWPRISVWQGDADRTVAPINAERILAQWTRVHGIARIAPEDATIEGSRHRLWRDAAGTPLIEAWDIPGMGHGTPVRADGPDADGIPGPFMLEAGIASTRAIARFWGLIPASSAAPAPPPPAPDAPGAHHHGIAAIIEKALRVAGLTR